MEYGKWPGLNDKLSEKTVTEWFSGLGFRAAGRGPREVCPDAHDEQREVKRASD